MATPPPSRTRTPSGKTVKTAPGSHPPLRKTPKGTTYAQGRPHQPSSPSPAPATGTPAPASSTKAPASPPVARTGGGVRPGQALGGLIVGAFAWGFASNWLSGGQSQAYGWLRAKFLNEPSSSTSSAPSSPSSTPKRPPPPPTTNGHGPGHPLTAP